MIHMFQNGMPMILGDQVRESFYHFCHFFPSKPLLKTFLIILFFLCRRWVWARQSSPSASWPACKRT